MKKIFLIIFLFIIFPLPAFSSSIDNIFGFWISENPLPGHSKKSIMVITKNSIKNGKRSPVACKFSQSDDEIIATFEGPLKTVVKYGIKVKGDRLFLTFPNATGSHGSRTYFRVNDEEDAKKYLQ